MGDSAWNLLLLDTAPLASFVLVLLLVWWLRPAPSRVRALDDQRSDARADQHRVRAFGALVRSGARLPVDPVHDDRLGRAVLIGLGVGFLGPPIGFGGFAFMLPVGVLAGLVAWVRPALRERAEGRRRAEAVVDGLPDLVDLLAVAVGAGLTVPQALSAVGARLGGPHGDALRRLTRRLELGVPRAEAVRVLVDELGDPARPLVAALQGADRDGLPLGPTLHRIGDDARSRRRRQAEAAARRIPVRLLFPLVLCTLPAFVLLTVVPLLVGTLSSLGPRPLR